MALNDCLLGYLRITVRDSGTVKIDAALPSLTPESSHARQAHVAASKQGRTAFAIGSAARPSIWRGLTVLASLLAGNADYQLPGFRKVPRKSFTPHPKSSTARTSRPRISQPRRVSTIGPSAPLR